MLRTQKRLTVKRVVELEEVLEGFNQVSSRGIWSKRTRSVQHTLSFIFSIH